MDDLTGLINRIRDHLPALHGQMTPADWEAFQEDLIRLPPVGAGDGEKSQIKLFYELHTACLKYPPVRRLLGNDPTMLAGTPQPRQIDEPVGGLAGEPVANRVPDVSLASPIIERMTELGSPKPSDPEARKQTEGHA